MRITDIKIDGFGVWRDLVLRGLSPEITVFYGPNEAGKSTLMQFMIYPMFDAPRYPQLSARLAADGVTPIRPVTEPFACR